METSKNRPKEPGIYIFKGIRWSPSKVRINSISTIVLVKQDKAYPELMVAYFGTGKLHRISYHEGAWQYIGDMLNE